MRINQNTILNYINNPQLFEDKEKEEIRNELARQGIQQEREKQYYIKEIEKLNNIIKELTQENLKRSDKIDELLEIKNKAIEYIEINYQHGNDISCYEELELLEILKGENNE